MRPTRTRAVISALVVTTALAGCASEANDDAPDDIETETDTDGEDEDEDDTEDEGEGEGEGEG